MNRLQLWINLIRKYQSCSSFMFDKILKYLGLKKKAVVKSIQLAETREPTAEEWQLAKNNLKKAERNASFAELGGFRPDKDNRKTSWWGGNFLGLKGEDIPVCEDSGRIMHPVLQIRMDELPYHPEALQGIALLTLWFDLQTTVVRKASNGHGFEIRTYDTLENLVPLGPGYREHETFPTFPIKWHGLKGDLPEWEAFDGAPTMVMRYDNSDWFFDQPSRERRAELQQTMPVKVGGHDQWWQSPQHVEGGRYVFFMDSTMRGQFGFPAGGNGNFFRISDDWELRVDFT